MKKLFCTILILAILPITIPSKALSVSADSAVLIDAISGEVLYCKNADKKLPMASTTKIMTALLLCESGDLDREITVTPEMVYVEGTSMGLRVGKKVSLNDILYGMLLASGNDAANAAAVSVGGSIEKFVIMMNEKAETLGLKNTHFNTPSGLDGDSHYTTSYDLAMLTRYALKNSDFYKASSTKTKTVKIGEEKITLSNHNRLLSMYADAVGVKTGFTKKSGRCLVSAAERDNARIIAVTLNDKNDWQDHIAMLDYGFSHIDDRSVTFEEKEYKIPVFSGEESYLTVTSKKAEFRTLKGKTVEKEEYIFPFLYAPISENEIVGYVQYKSGGYIVGSETIYAAKSIDEVNDKNFLLKIKNNFLNIIRLI